MTRLLSPQLIDGLEDLRSELENLISINNEIRQDRLSKQREKDGRSSAMSTTMTKSIFSETKNASFLNQELVMFIDNLHQKATEVGLKEDALIPKDSKVERQIYQQVMQARRPQSALTSNSQKSKEQMRREKSPTQTAMRSSFYSISLLNDKDEAVDENVQATRKFKEEQAKQRGSVIDQLNITNILELSQRDTEVIN